MRYAFPAIAVALALAGCGGSKQAALTTTARSTSAPSTTTASPSTTTTVAPAGALQAEANAKATGDIPDNQVFLVFRNRAAGWSMKYPEGWAEQAFGSAVTFRDKNNIVRVVVGHGGAVTVAAARAGLHGARAQAIALPAGRAIKVSYSSESAPNAVTGKRVTLVVDRYYLWKGGRRAVVDLGTPQGVDNVDAYRLMIESFRWS